MATNSGVTAAKRRRAGGIQPAVSNSHVNNTQDKVLANSSNNENNNNIKIKFNDALQLTVKKIEYLESLLKVNENNTNLLLNELTTLKTEFDTYRTNTSNETRMLTERISSLEEGHTKDNKLNLKDVDIKVEKLQQGLDATRNIILNIQNEVLTKNLETIEK